MSLEIPSGIILLWPGSGSIPSGFSRNTDFDDKFPLGAANEADGGSPGGSSTHSHSTTHSHSATSHTHTFTTPPARGNKLLDPYPGSGSTVSSVAASAHTHSWTSASGSQSWSGGNSFGTGSSEPSYYTMRFIESNGSADTYPTNCIVMRNDADGVSGWTQHSGSKSKYLRGAGSGANGGGTGGGSHTHSLPSHNHSGGGHGHGTQALSGAANSSEGPVGAQSAPQREETSHQHAFNTTGSDGSGSTGSASATSDSHTQANPYFFLWGLEKTDSSADEDEGMIVLWDGTIDNIPDDWLICDGNNSTPDLRDRFIKFANSSGEVGGTGGTNSHSHGGGSHGHSTASGHTHSVYSSYAWPSHAYNNHPSGGQSPWPPGTGLGSRYNNYHSAAGPWTTNSTSPSIPSTSASNNTNSDTRPAYRTVCYLYSPEGEAAGGGNIGMFGSNF